ncbi:hypothetical protein [Pedobacter aquatilis]|uniref:hypothetical protein n=1 Tax=Pedobacter aquatilis TaxID=351343 RepID=UPI00292E8F37|nr:hypothetical protein [Pedobacter aquatilis]
MSAYSINTHDQELAKVFGDLDSSVRKTKLYFGLVGLKIALPFILCSFSIKLSIERRLVARSLNKLIKNFHKLDEREQMKIELDLSNDYQDLANALTPLVSLIKTKKLYFSRLCISQFEKAQNDLKYYSEKITSLVYPETIDPANDPILFKELVDCYKDVDLSDWKQEDRLEKSKVSVNHVQV